MTTTQWSDDGFLDGLRRQGDPLADAAVQRLIDTHQTQHVNRLFQVMRTDDQSYPPDLPEPFLAFLEQTKPLPPGVDLDRVKRGEEIYMKHAFTAALVLLAKGLPEGYQAPCLTEILLVSRDLARSPYDRLLGVLQMLVRVCSIRGFSHGGAVVITAQKMRLLHAGVRSIVYQRRSDYVAKYGVPVNLEDKLATIIAFSYLVVEGLKTLNVGLKDDEAEDLYYVWRVYSQMMGIYPEGRPDSTEYIPQNLAEAGEFYASYSRRHYVEHNPGGIILTRDHLNMLRDMIPRLLRWLGLGAMPAIYMRDLMGDTACRRLEIAPVPGHRVLKDLLIKVVELWQRGVDHLPGHGVEKFSQLVFQGMINRQYGGQVQFLIPDSVAALHRLDAGKDARKSGARLGSAPA